MPHIILNKQKLLNRIKRIRGQVDGVAKALQQDHDCMRILQTLTSCHGAMKSLMTEIIEDHVRSHVVDPKEKPTFQQSKAAEELIDIIKSYLK